MATDNPFLKYRPAETGSAAPRVRQVIPPKPPAPVDPVVAEGRVLDNEIKRKNLSKPEGDNLPQGWRMGPNGVAERIPGLPETAATATDDSLKAASKTANIESLTKQINHVQELFNSGQRDNAIPLLGSLWEYLPTQANTAFDSAAAGLAEQGLAAFRVPGVGAQSDTELRQFVEANKPSSWSNDSSNLERLQTLRLRLDETRKALGLPPAEWLGVDGSPPEKDDQAAARIAAAAEPPAGPGAGEVPTTGYTPAAGDQRLVDDQNTRAKVDEMLRSGAPFLEINRFLVQQGDNPLTAQDYKRVRQAITKGEPYNISAQKYEPVTPAEQVITGLGSGAAGAYALGAGQFLSGNTLDNVAADPERARLAMAIAEAEHPTATTAGNISGGVMASLLGEAGLAKAGMQPGLVRGLLSDVGAGAANGAGAADGGDRATGAASGGVQALLGSLGGTGVTKLAGRVLSPTGGGLGKLYAAGVRPTPGQRFADSGTVGRTVNSIEEGLQSVPIVGHAIRGARQEARDQFQIGAFNQALAEIGEELPAGTKPGNAAHKYAQEAFNRVYEHARSGMRAAGDEELSNDLASLSPDIETLSDTMRNRLGLILDRTVGRSIQDGELTGQGYKAAVSDLRKHIARFGSSTNAEERQSGEILQGVLSALDGAARRHSDPEAVALLDAADAGYSQLVRIEGAAARRGGDSGTFSPAQFDAEVQKASGGVRSKAYLRGEARMQDYATAGRSLDDKMPNSGTADRAMIAGGVGGAGLAYLSPKAAAVLGTIGALYAPGVRRVTKGAFAPPGPARKAISLQLQKRARLAGRATAATAVASSQETAVGQ